MTHQAADVPRRAVVSILGLLTLLGIGNALYVLLSGGALWMDEIIAITHTLEPMPYFFIEVLRHDIHPFFYFLVLKAWSALVPGADIWILASSFVAAVFSTSVIALVTYRLYGSRAMWWALAIFTLLPTTAWAAGTLRMYALLPGLLVLVWYAGRRVLQSGSRAWLAWMVVLELSVIYIHAIGFFFAAITALAAMIEEYRKSAPGDLRDWWYTQVIVGFLALPVVASALIRGTEKLPIPGIGHVLKMPGQIVAGWNLQHNELAIVAGSVIFLVLLFFSLRDRRGRTATLVIVIGAILLAILASMAGKSMLKIPIYSASLLPFLAICAAAGIASATSLVARVIPWLLMGVLAIVTVTWAKNLEQHSDYQVAAYHLSERVKPGDLVVLDNTFWGIMRYAVGPDWGRPLEVAPLEDNAAWKSLKAKLGPGLTAAFRLDPLRDYVDHEGVRYVYSSGAASYSANSKNIWLVFDKQLSDRTTVGVSVKPMEVTSFRRLAIVSTTRSDTGNSVVDLNELGKNLGVRP